MKPDIVRTIGMGPYQGVLELYREPARRRTVLYGQRRLARIRTPDLFVTCLRGARGHATVGLLRPDSYSLCSTGVPHGDSLGFVCVGSAAIHMVALEKITPSEALWMTTFEDARCGVDVEHGIMRTQSRWTGIDELVALLTPTASGPSPVAFGAFGQRWP